jgi:hypothetical protein
MSFPTNSVLSALASSSQHGAATPSPAQSTSTPPDGAPHRPPQASPSLARLPRVQVEYLACTRTPGARSAYRRPQVLERRGPGRAGLLHGLAIDAAALERAWPKADPGGVASDRPARSAEQQEQSECDASDQRDVVLWVRRAREPGADGRCRSRARSDDRLYALAWRGPVGAGTGPNGTGASGRGRSRVGLGAVEYVLPGGFYGSS